MDSPPAAYRQVSQAPTLPGGAPHEPDFDVAALYETPLGTGTATDSLPLDEKLTRCRRRIPARDAGGASAMLCAWSTCPECRDRRWTG